MHANYLRLRAFGCDSAHTSSQGGVLVRAATRRHHRGHGAGRRGPAALTPELSVMTGALADAQRTADTAGPDALVLAAAGLLAWAVWTWGAVGLALTAPRHCPASSAAPRGCSYRACCRPVAAAAPPSRSGSGSPSPPPWSPPRPAFPHSRPPRRPRLNWWPRLNRRSGLNRSFRTGRQRGQAARPKGLLIGGAGLARGPDSPAPTSSCAATASGTSPPGAPRSARPPTGRPRDRLGRAGLVAHERRRHRPRPRPPAARPGPAPSGAAVSRPPAIPVPADHLQGAPPMTAVPPGFARTRAAPASPAPPRRRADPATTAAGRAPARPPGPPGCRRAPADAPTGAAAADRRAGARSTTTSVRPGPPAPTCQMPGRPDAT